MFVVTIEYPFRNKVCLKLNDVLVKNCSAVTKLATFFQADLISSIHVYKSGSDFPSLSVQQSGGAVLLAVLSFKAFLHFFLQCSGALKSFLTKFLVEITDKKKKKKGLKESSQILQQAISLRFVSQIRGESAGC